MKLTIIALLFSSLLFGQAQLSVNQNFPVSVYPGQSTLLNVNLTGSAGLDIAGIQWNNLLVPNSTVTIAPGSASSVATKGVFCNTPQSMCLVTGLTGPLGAQVVSNNVYSDGVVATINMTVPANTPAGVVPLSVTGTLAAAQQGWFVPITAAPAFSLTVLSMCDLNGDGKIDANDVILMVNQATQKAPCTNDLTGDGTCDAQDVQRVVIAASGGACLTGPVAAHLAPATKQKVMKVAAPKKSLLGRIWTKIKKL